MVCVETSVEGWRHPVDEVPETASIEISQNGLSGEAAVY